MRLNLPRSVTSSAAAPIHETAAGQGSARTARERLLHTLSRERHQCRPADTDTPLLRRLLNQEPDEGCAL
jgi:hypothetical protein